MAALDSLLRPRSVAVIGASRKRGTIGAEVFHNLLRSGFQGAVYPVNPHTAVVQSVRAYASIADVPDPVDLAVLVVPSADVPAAVEACAHKGVRALVVIGAGFAETGRAGRALQDQVLATARAHGMRLVGPNCLGVVNADPAVGLNATFAPSFPPFGNVGFSSQSGALGLTILERAAELGVGISTFVSVGNKADVSGNDLLEHWEHDPATRVILLYLENLGNPRRFLEIARRVARVKPIAVVKSGRTEAGARAASSHTGALAGRDVAVDALLAQAGVIRTDTIDELFDVAVLLAHQPVPRGRRVAIVTNAGGPGIMASDACESRGLEVARLGPAVEAELRGFLPPEASVHNPVDMIASASASSYERALRAVLAAESVDAVLVLFVTPIVTAAGDVATAVVRAAEGSSKPVAACFMGRGGIPEALAELRARRIPTYTFPEAAAAALARAAHHGAWLAEPAGAVPELAVDPARARAALAGRRGWLAPAEVAEVLAAYGLRSARAREAATAADAARAADALGYPVALKLVSSAVTHKTEAGGVRLGLRSADEVRTAFAQVTAHGGTGVLVQEMIAGGVETLVGATRDPSYGHLVGFGLGGVMVELMRDVGFRVAPLRDVDARALLDGVRGRALLEGFRGGPRVDRAALEDALLRVSRLVGDFPVIAELDLNPLMALPAGAVAVDARVRVDDA